MSMCGPNALAINEANHTGLGICILHYAACMANSALRCTGVHQSVCTVHKNQKAVETALCNDAWEMAVLDMGAVRAVAMLLGSRIC